MVQALSMKFDIYEECILESRGLISRDEKLLRNGNQVVAVKNIHILEKPFMMLSP